MKRQKTLAAIMLCALSCTTLAAERPIVPKDLQGLPSFEIGDLIYRLMQPKGHFYIPWAHMANSGILWLTDGYEKKDSTAYRGGVLRVNVAGNITTKLERHLMEVPWTIAYGTAEAPNFGAIYATIIPASFEMGQCFGSTYTMCDVDILASLKRTPAKVEVLCHSDSFRFPSVYRLTENGKEPLTVGVVTEGGSGGAYSMIFAAIQAYKTDEELCEANYG